MFNKIDLIFEVVDYTYLKFSKCTDRRVQESYLQIAAYLVDQTVIGSLSAANTLQQHILKGVGQWDALKLVKPHVIMASHASKGLSKPSFKHIPAQEVTMYKRVIKLLEDQVDQAHQALTLENIKTQLIAHTG